MKSFKFFWTAHKWTGIVLSLVFAMIATTGFLLLLKKEFAWIQPATETGEAGAPAEFVPLQTIFATVLAQGHPDFQTVDDIDRIDFRPGKRVHKVRSRHHHTEFQVDAVTGALIAGPSHRTSDLIEQIHDGSFFAGWIHDFVMPLVAMALVFLIFSGLWLWLEPIVRKRRRRRAHAAR